MMCLFFFPGRLLEYGLACAHGTDKFHFYMNSKKFQIYTGFSNNFKNYSGRHEVLIVRNSILRSVSIYHASLCAATGARDPLPHGSAHTWSGRVMDSESDAVARTTGGGAKVVRAAVEVPLEGIHHRRG
jgi:hypothetical protein